MIGIFLLTVVLATLVVMAFKPKLGAILVWPIIFLYPHLYMFRLGILPWNAGVDDLFIGFFFIIVVVRRNLLGGVPIRFGLSVAGALAYLMIWTTANLSGWIIMPQLLPVEVIKPILKCLVFALFAYSMVHCIDDQRDLRRVAIAFFVTLTAAGFTVILHHFFPKQMVIFTNAKVELFQSWYGKVPRAVGSLMNPNTGCVILGMTVVFATRLLKLVPTLAARVSLIAGVVIMLVAMLITESRTGAIALGLVLLSMMTLSRARLFAGIMVVGMILLVVVSPMFISDFMSRFSAALNTVGDPELGPGVQSRIDTWGQYARDATAQTILFGQGQLVPTIQIGFHAHSSYISALFVHGIAGLIWFLVFFGLLVKRGLAVAHSRIEPYCSLAAGLLWGILLFSIAGLTLDLLTDFNTRFLFLFYAVMIERCYAIVYKRRVPRTRKVIRRRPTIAVSKIRTA